MAEECQHLVADPLGRRGAARSKRIGPGDLDIVSQHGARRYIPLGRGNEANAQRLREIADTSEEPRGVGRAVELKTGKVQWNEERFLAGTITMVGDRLLVMREGGEMILAPASPQAFRPVAHAQVLTGTVRAYPAVADGFVYVRNDATLICLDLRR